MKLTEEMQQVLVSGHHGHLSLQEQKHGSDLATKTPADEKVTGPISPFGSPGSLIPPCCSSSSQTSPPPGQRCPGSLVPPCFSSKPVL